MFRSVVFAALGFIPGLGASGVLEAQDRAFRFTPATFVADDSTKVEAEIGKLRVAENRLDSRSRTINLDVVRFSALPSAPTGSVPIIYLAGGPGQPGTISASGSRFPLFMAMRAAGDVVVLNQRGSLGESNTVCSARLPIPIDTPSTAQQLRTRFVPWLRQCADSLRRAGFDLRGYNTVENARDIEALRIALGAERISLLGISYGTHLALAYARAFPGRLHRMVLAGTEGPDQTYKLPGSVDRAFRRIDSTYLAQTGEVPARSIGARLTELRDRLAQQPARAEVSSRGKNISVVVGPVELDLLAFGATGSREGIAQLSQVLDASLAGNFQFLARALWQEAQRGARATLFAMDCASGISPTRAAQLRKEERTIRFAAVINMPFPDACSAVPHRKLDERFRAPVRGEMPVLFISGDLDTRTPVEHATEIAAGFSNASHLIIRGAAHDNDLLVSDEGIGRGIVAFLRGSNASGIIQLPPLFQRR